MKSILLQLSCLAVLILCIYSQSIIVQNKGSQIIAITPTVQIIITGNQNVPKFAVLNLNGTEGYKIQLQQAYQADQSGKALPSTTISLPSFTWLFSSFAVENGTTVDGKTSDVVHFNITSTAAPTTTKTKFQFRIALNAVQKFFKFDTIVESVDWKQGSTQFVICYKLLVENSNQEHDTSATSPITTSGDEMKLLFGGGGFVSIKTQAKSGDAINTPVSASIQSSGNSKLICTNYAKWTIDPLIHDPTVGFTSTSTSWLWLLVPAGIVVGGIAIIFVAALVIGAIGVAVILKSRKPQYSTF